MKVTIDAVLTGTPSPLPGSEARSAIARTPVEGPVHLSRNGLDGDVVGDPKHHGGPEKAIHHFARENYRRWDDWLPGSPLLRAPGAFGENLSTTGMDEDTVCVGDVLSVGSAVVQVSQGRQPCWKLDARHGRRGTARRMQQMGRTGWYYRVLETGDVSAGDRIVLQDRPEPDWTIRRLLGALFDRSTPEEVWADAASIPTLSPGWREIFADRLRHRRIEDWTPRLRDEP